VIEVRLAASGRTRTGLYGADGRLVRDLGERWFGAGSQRFAWDGRDASGEHLPPGIYFLVLDAGGQRAAAKVTLLR
jgi:flagellar hook assembly protein FlgD